MNQATSSNIQSYSRAGLPRRLAALLYDGFLVGAIWMLVGYLVQLVVGPDTSQLIDGVVQTDPLLDNILFVLMFASASSFYIWFWTRGGQTLGMMAWHMKVVSLDGSSLKPMQSMLRFVAAWPAFFIFGLGYLWMYIDPQRDALHDKLTHSKVLVIPKQHRQK